MSVNLGARGDQLERVTADMVSGNYFAVLGVRPILGRAFLPEDDQTPGTHPVAVISDDLWQRYFGSDPAALGKPLTLNGHDFTVVGVAPRGFKGTDLSNAVEIWVPLMMHEVVWPLFAKSGFNLLASRGSDNFDPIGRLKPGVSLAQAKTAMGVLARQQAEVYPDESHKGWSVTVWPINEAKISPWSRSSAVRLAGLMSAVVGLVLLIACANVASLLLARSETRRREIGVRAALGASRARLVFQLLAESILLSLLGGCVGVLVAIWTTDLLLTFNLPGIDPQALGTTLDSRVLCFALLLSLVTAMVFGLVPALQASRMAPATVLKELSLSPGRRPSKSGLQQLAVISQLALCLVLLISAGLLLRTLQKLQSIKLGFDTGKVLLVPLDLATQGYSRSQANVFYAHLLERLAGLPVLRSVSLAENVPLGPRRMGTCVAIAGRQPPPGLPCTPIEYNAVTSGYFSTMRIPLLRGRDFATQDTEGSPGVVIVNETTARRFWPGEDPIGKTFSLWNPKGESPPVQVVGVVKDGRYQSSWRDDPSPFVFVPLYQEPYFPLEATLHLRSDANLPSVVGAVRQEVQALDKSLPLLDIRTMKEQASSALSPERMRATLLGAFGLLALTLAAIGIYGLMSYSVNQRTHEIGVRMALGAEQDDVLRLVVGQGMRLTFVGAGIGLVGAFALTRFLRAFLFGVTPTDPIAFVGVSILLTAVALLAGYIPARRATKVGPMVALRYE
jgi:predicted permease